LIGIGKSGFMCPCLNSPPNVSRAPSASRAFRQTNAPCGFAIRSVTAASETRVPIGLCCRVLTPTDHYPRCLFTAFSSSAMASAELVTKLLPTRQILVASKGLMDRGATKEFLLHKLLHCNGVVFCGVRIPKGTSRG